MTRRAAAPGLGEAVWLWGLYAAVGAAIFGTHARVAGRVPDGMAAAASADLRPVAVYLRHPVAPAAVPIGVMALSRVGRAGAPAAIGRAVAVGGGVLALTTAARAGIANALAAGAVGIGVTLTVEAARGCGVGGAAPGRRADGVRVALAGGLLVVSVPWVLADIGIYVGDVPLVGAYFLSRQRLPPGAGGPDVHLGHHHGMDGALLAWTGLALSRQLAAVSHLPIRGALSSGLAGMTVYGVARAAEDAWYEQVVKRGRTSRRLPSLVRHGRPVGRRAWAALLGWCWLVHRGLRWEVAGSVPVPVHPAAPTARRRRREAAVVASG